MNKGSEIRDFYSGRSVFLTGVSGFLGKALLEKLLRSCPNVSKVYVLIRDKHGKDPNSRLKNIFQSPIFENLKLENPEAINKVYAIAGDITLPDLAISPGDREMLCKSVSVVIHSAASIKFNEPIKVALNINYNGTKRILELCKQLDSLEALVHVSTAYCNCDLEEIPEDILTPDLNLPTPEEIELMSDTKIEQITSMIIGEKPNTYTYAKCQAEYLLKKEGSQLPICIVRPSIIVAAWKEPEPGFVDSLNGLTGIVAATGKGILNSIVCDKKKVSDIIPLDMTVNLILATGWKTAVQKSMDIPVYNCCSGSLNPIDYEMIREYSFEMFDSHPFDRVIRHHRLRFVTTHAFNILLNFWTNLLPFFLVDCFAVIVRRKPRMLKLLNKTLVAVGSTAYFRMNEWKFVTKNMVKLENSMGPMDRELFFWNIKDLDWKEYFKTYCLGIKKCIFKENLSNISKTQTRRTRLSWIEKLCQFFIIFSFGILLTNWF